MAECLDEAFLPLADFIKEVTDIDAEISDRKTGMTMTAETIDMSMPIELDLQVEENGDVLIGAIPPLYYVETTVLPVFHQLTINLELTNPEADGE